MVFQSYTLLPWLTARGNVELALEAVGKSKQECRSIADEHLDLVRLTRLADAFPSELSGGLKPRGANAPALSYRPKMLLMDEPFGALDALTRHDMTRLRAVTATSAPARARASAIDSPMPRLAPVTSATRPPRQVGHRSSSSVRNLDPVMPYGRRQARGHFRRGSPRRSRSRCGDRHSVRVRLRPSVTGCRAGPRRRGGWACRRRRRRAARRPPRPAPRVPVGRHQTV